MEREREKDMNIESDVTAMIQYAIKCVQIGECETKYRTLLLQNGILHHMTRPGSVLEGFRHTLNRHALESGLFPLS
jgi:hypothetical protein